MTLLFSREIGPGNGGQQPPQPPKDRPTREQRELATAKRREQVIEDALEEMQKQMDLIRAAVKSG